MAMDEFDDVSAEGIQSMLDDIDVSGLPGDDASDPDFGSIEVSSETGRALKEKFQKWKGERREGAKARRTILRLTGVLRKVAAKLGKTTNYAKFLSGVGKISEETITVTGLNGGTAALAQLASYNTQVKARMFEVEICLVGDVGFAMLLTALNVDSQPLITQPIPLQVDGSDRGPRVFLLHPGGYDFREKSTVTYNYLGNGAAICTGSLRITFRPVPQSNQALADAILTGRIQVG